MAALTRVERFGIYEATSKKYTGIATLAWCGCVFIVAHFANVRDWRLAYIFGPASALALFIYFGQAKELAIFAKWNAGLEDGATSLQFDGDDGEREQAISDDLAHLRALHDRFLLPARAAFYAIRPRIDDNIDLPAENCRGGLELKAVPGVVPRERPTFQFEGWAWSDAWRSVPEYVLIIDAAARVRGMGMMTRRAQIVDDIVGADVSRAGYSGFFGYFASSGYGTYWAVAYRNGTQSCKFLEFKL
jgi:hypothetical protein